MTSGRALNGSRWQDQQRCGRMLVSHILSRAVRWSAWHASKLQELLAMQGKYRTHSDATDGDAQALAQAHGEAGLKELQLL